MASDRVGFEVVRIHPEDITAEPLTAEDIHKAFRELFPTQAEREAYKQGYAEGARRAYDAFERGRQRGRHEALEQIARLVEEHFDEAFCDD